MSDLVGTGLTLRPLVGALTRFLEAGEDFAVAETVGYIASDYKVYKADADDAAKAAGQLVVRVADELARTDGTIKAGDMGTWVLTGPVAGWTSLDATKQVFLSGTAGRAADASGTVIRALGWPLSASVMNWNPGDDRSSS